MIDNPDPAMSSYYTSIPVSMWMTLLNLNGESPLCDYSAGTMQYNTIQYNQYNGIQYNAIQCNTTQYNAIQYNDIQYNSI